VSGLGENSGGRSPLALRFARRLAAPLALGEDLLVLAPHPDDETLGCGGTIHLARQAGARVTIAFLTDGADSHAHLLDRGELVALRRAEAAAAAAVLGVGEEDLRFLALPDGRLGGAEPQAREQLAALVAERGPGALLAPCAWDVSDDHLAAARIAAAVAAAAGLPVHGYATWFWDRWPWTATRAGSWPRTLARAARGDLRLATRFRTAVELGPALAVKRRALAQHRTQVERREGNPDWPILADASAGRWLGLNLAPVELFASQVVVP
jgi:LmbE family N-acetylglucosaminyl deacetylase